MKVLFAIAGAVAATVTALVVGVVVLLSPGGSTSSECGNIVAGTTVFDSSGQQVTADPSSTAVVQTAIGVGKALGIPEQGWVIAVMQCTIESGCTDVDGGLLGAFGPWQETPADGWGSQSQVTNVSMAAEAIYGAEPIGMTSNTGLLEVPNWQALAPGVVAQDVEKSAYPGRYATVQSVAEQVVAANASAPAVPLPLTPRVVGPGSSGGSSVVLDSSAACGGVVDDSAVTGTAGAVIAAAESQLGVPYSWGGGTLNGPSLGIDQGAGTVGFDCSHLVAFAFWEGAHISFPAPSQSQYASTLPEEVPLVNGQVLLSALVPGDVVFYEGVPPAHVAIYIGNGQIVEAPQTGEVVHLTSWLTPGQPSGAVDILGASS